jgi:hypothetical protein
MKRFAILRKDRTILVKTPKPYTVTAYQDLTDAYPTLESMRDIEHDLNEHTKFLYNCLKMLGISKSMAVRQRYTLNTDTGDRLSHMALHDERISHEMRMVIRNHNW